MHTEPIMNSWALQNERNMVQTPTNPTEDNPDCTIGASEIAAVMGLSPWLTPYGLWAHKMGLTRPDNKALARGRRLERVVLEIASDELGVAIYPGLQHPGPSLYHPEIGPWATARPDGFTILDGQRLTVEAKVAQNPKDWGSPADLDAPLEYVTQVAWQCAVAESDGGLLAGLMMQGLEPKLYKFPRQASIEDELLQRARRWLDNHVVAGTPPALDGSEDARRWLTSRWNESTGSVRKANADEARLLAQLAAVKAEIKSLEAQEAELGNLARQAIGPDDGLAWEGGKATWKWQDGARRIDTERLKREAADIYAAYSTKADPSRVLRLSTAK